MQEDGDSGEKDDINIEENEKEEETGLTVADLAIGDTPSRPP